MSPESEYTMHSETLKLALKPDHEKEAARRVHVGFVNGKRTAIATDFTRLHAEPSESCVTTAGPMPAVGQVLVPESERRAVQPPEPAAVLQAEALGAKCRETALVAVGGQALNAHYVADALRHVGTVGACYVKVGLDHPPVTFESAEHPGRWACVMPCHCHADDVDSYCAEKIVTLERVAARMDSAEEHEDEDEAEAENRALRAELEKSRAAVAHVLAKIRDVPELYWHLGAMTEAERLLFAAYSSQHGISLAEAKKRFAPEPAAYNRWCDEREDADRLIAIGREHDTEGKGAAK